MEEKIKNKNFGRLTIVSDEFKYDRQYSRKYQCLCTCGNLKWIRLSNLISGTTKSCGCYGKKRRLLATIKHGMSGHKLDNMFTSMKQRCYNSNNPGYKDYGGRGIKICDEWLNDRSLFFKWCIENGWDKKLQIDRRDNDDGYSPDNCRFVVSQINILNSRPKKNKTGFIGVNKHRNKNRTKRFGTSVTYNGIYTFLGWYKTGLEAANIRDNFIIFNNLPLTLNNR